MRMYSGIRASAMMPSHGSFGRLTALRGEHTAESEAAGGKAIPPVDWNALPASVDPARGGRLGAADDGTRGERKRWQVESIYAVIYQLLQHAHVPVRSPGLCHRSLRPYLTRLTLHAGFRSKPYVKAVLLRSRIFPRMCFCSGSRRPATLSYSRPIVPRSAQTLRWKQTPSEQARQTEVLSSVL
jgi:hypothetical protein